MWNYFGGLLLLLSPLPSNSLPADLGTGRLLSLESDIKEVQERWKQYRNLVTDGFFLNDSMIFLADFFGGQQHREEGQEENDADYHHYFSFQDYMMDGGTGLDIGVVDNIDLQDNRVDHIVPLENTDRVENIQMSPDSDKVAIGETNNDAGGQMDSFTQNSDITETDATPTERNVEFKEMKDIERIRNNPTFSEAEPPAVNLPAAGKLEANGAKDDTSKFDGDGLEQMETDARNIFKPVGEDEEGLKEVGVEGKGLEQVNFTKMINSEPTMLLQNALLYNFTMGRVVLKTR